MVHHTLSFLDEFKVQTNQTWREELLRVQVRAWFGNAMRWLELQVLVGLLGRQ